MKNVIVIFGGESAEHEVSVITGLQVVEKIDKEKFMSFAAELTQEGIFKYYEGLTSRKDYLKIKPQIINFGKDESGVFFVPSGILKNKVYFDAAFLAFHGGNGESGQIQGFFEALNVPYTSPNVEASAISMNKALTKEVLEAHDINTAPWDRVFSDEVKKDANIAVRAVLSKISLPIIIKPVHLGSSIAINIAKTRVELKKYLLLASQVDSEILVEKLMNGFTEYNIAVRKIGENIEVSEIERPLSHDEILSFADKYQRGGKKQGGMASLNRELPAKMSTKLSKEIENTALQIFKVIRGKGMIRIDFMVVGSRVYVTEVNPIPGSMAYYLWEASGINFKDQITDLINQSIKDNEERNSKKISYDTDIVEKFIKGNKDH